MRGRCLIWLLACTALVGCASSEGGVTGTGISSISGNIAVVSTQSAAPAAVTLPFPIRVTVAEVPGIASITDADGAFQLDGAFSGAVTLQFSNADDGAEIGPLALDIPAGSQTVLENIEIHTAAPLSERVRPAAVRLFDLFGHVDLVECRAAGSGMLLVTDDAQPPRQFMIALTADTEVVTAGAAPLTCADIPQFGAVRVEGFLRRDDQTIVALLVAVDARRPPPPGPSPRPERARGVVDAVSCDRGLVEIEQRGVLDPVQRVVRLDDRTEFRCGLDVPAPCDCSAIAVGKPIAVEGLIFPRQPGQIQAHVVFLGSTSTPVDVTGTISRLACAIDELAILTVGNGGGARVVLTSETQIVCRSGLACACTDLHPGQPVRVEGARPAEGGPITADRITVLSRRRGPAG